MVLLRMKEQFLKRKAEEESKSLPGNRRTVTAQKKSQLERMLRGMQSEVLLLVSLGVL
jgi:hypothetical protein